MHYLKPNWPAPASVKAYTTLRTGGYSKAPYDSFNLSVASGDDAEAVAKNRQQLKHELHLSQEPAWLQQMHGTNVVCADSVNSLFPPQADASWTIVPGIPCAVLTADCLPLLLCDDQGLQVAAVHAGWRGLASGVIEATFAQLKGLSSTWLAWLGPAIGPAVFEVGEEVREQFVRADAQAALAFKSFTRQKWLADIYLLAKQRLARLGITRIYGGEYCTWSDSERFYSYRRDAGKTGRMVSVIWIDSRF